MRFIVILISVLSLLMSGCGNEQEMSDASGGGTSGDAVEERARTEDSTTPEASSGSDVKALYTWVDRLNLRSQANTNSDVVTTLNSDTPLQPTGNQTAESDAIVLRGVLYEEPWLEVSTPDGKTGWVFGGAVKAEDELKGNDPISDTQFNFPIFGDYDLGEWTSMGVDQGDGEGDFDQLTRQYSNGQLRLTIDTYEGEYGYGYDYRLLNENGQLLKQRSFDFSNMAEPIEMTEEVIDYRDDPAMRYYRQQSSPIPYQQLNARPMIVNNDWESEPYSQ
ncbi:MAG: SH3 domain-containing protein [Bacteroidota bacterium]